MEIILKKNESLIKDYIDKLQWFKPDNNSHSELKGNLKEKDTLDWSDKFKGNLGVFREYNIHQETTSVLYALDRKFCGFNGDLYLDFRNLVDSVFENSTKNITIEETESTIFEWLINFKKSEDYSQSLPDFFLKKFENKIDQFGFYFPVNNLNIESEIIIGEVTFTYFTKQYFDDFYKVSKMPQEAFDGIFRKRFQGETIVIVEGYGSNKRAYQIAKEKALLSVDLLKVLSLTSQVPKRHVTFDLAFRLPYQLQTQYLSKKVGVEYDYNINLNMGNIPTEFNNQLIHITQKWQKEVYNDFITNYTDTELNRLIKQSLHILANAFSTESLHQRIIEMISIIESILLEENREHKFAIKTKTRMKKLLPNRNNIVDIMDEFYNVRHKMVHKVIKLPINLDNLVQFQTLVIDTINQLISNRHIENKETLIILLDEGL